MNNNFIKGLISGIILGTGIIIGSSIEKRKNKKRTQKYDDIIGKIVINPEDSDMLIMLEGDPAYIPEGYHNIYVERVKDVKNIKNEYIN